MYVDTTLRIQPKSALLFHHPSWPQKTATKAAARSLSRGRGLSSRAPPHIVRKAGKRFKKRQKFDVMDFIEIDVGGPYASSVPCTVHKNSF